MTKTLNEYYSVVNEGDKYRSSSPIKVDPPRTGVWVAYTHSASLFDKDCPVVLFDSELAALRYAVNDISRIVKVVFVPFGKPIAEYLV